MQSAIVLSALAGFALTSAQVTGKLGDAVAVTDNPVGISYQAKLPELETTEVRGYVTATGGADGNGIEVSVSFTGIPATGGPFMYHVHDQPVPANGNCTATLAHQDPTERGEEPICDPSAPQTCQVGDLSGKHGMVTGASYENAYTDLYASIKPGLGAFIGNRSIVFHYANKTRITCANFAPVYTVSNSTTNNGTNPTTPPATSATPSSPPLPEYTGAATATMASIGMLFAGVMAALFL
ncbi:MAG: hypothetical protein M1833_003188 [Piccolia ochrophora]|nr:MAG: hypothetical protein M1833_003188 [Piccolia ochrophora]